MLAPNFFLFVPLDIFRSIFLLYLRSEKNFYTCLNQIYKYYQLIALTLIHTQKKTAHNFNTCKKQYKK